MSNLARQFERMAEKYEQVAADAWARGDMLHSARWEAKADALWCAASMARKA